jgi:pilus assembly protein CpaF
MEDGKRRLTSVQEINGMEGDIITMSEIFRFERQGVAEHDGKPVVHGQFRATGIVPSFFEPMSQRGIPLSVDIFDPQRGEGWGIN